MRVTCTELWESVNRIMFPEGGTFTAKDCGYTMSEALERCAVVMVRDNPHGKFYYESTHRWAMDQQNVIDSLRELRDNGFLNYKGE